MESVAILLGRQMHKMAPSYRLGLQLHATLTYLQRVIDTANRRKGATVGNQISIRSRQIYNLKREVEAVELVKC